MQKFIFVLLFSLSLISPETIFSEEPAPDDLSASPSAIENKKGSTGSSLGESEVTEGGYKTITKELVWIDGTIPDDSETTGDWVWDDTVKDDNSISHTTKNSKGINTHSFKTTNGIELKKSSKIVQDVFLDPVERPTGIMMKFLVQDGGDIVVYWEAEEEVFVDTNEYMTAWYMGTIPQAGEWVRLNIDMGEFEIPEGYLNGIAFIASNGKIWWGKTIIENQAPRAGNSV